VVGPICVGEAACSKSLRRTQARCDSFFQKLGRGVDYGARSIEFARENWNLLKKRAGNRPFLGSCQCIARHASVRLAPLSAPF